MVAQPGFVLPMEEYMKNIVKAQLFQIVRDKIMKYLVVLTPVMQILLVILPIWLDNQEPTGAGEFFAVDGSIITFFPIFYLIIATAEICGADFMDKTHHYELSGGHKRYEVYMGRVIAAALVGGVGALILTVLPVGLYGFLYGWGNKVDLAPILFRLLFMLLPYLRLVAEFAFLTFLIKNPYVIMGIGYVIFVMTSALASGTTIEAVSPFLGTMNLTMLCKVSQWATYGLGNDLNYIFDASVSAGTIWGTVAGSVVFGATALYLGYVFFQHDDMN